MPPPLKYATGNGQSLLRFLSTHHPLFAEFVPCGVNEQKNDVSVTEFHDHIFHISIAWLQTHVGESLCLPRRGCSVCFGGLDQRMWHTFCGRKSQNWPILEYLEAPNIHNVT